MSRERGRSSPCTYCTVAPTEKSRPTCCSTPALYCLTSGFWKFGANTKMVGVLIAAPVGTDEKMFGYAGMAAPVKLMVCTLMPLFECAVPIMIDGVRP